MLHLLSPPTFEISPLNNLFLERIFSASFIETTVTGLAYSWQYVRRFLDMGDTEQGTALVTSTDPKTEPVRSVDKTDNIVENEPDSDSEKKSVGAEEEEALFVAMEKDEESKETLRPHAQPKSVKTAPKLLQSAIEQGELKPDDSESDSEQPGSTNAGSEPHHAHSRVRNIVYCCSCSCVSSLPVPCCHKFIWTCEM